MAQGGRHKEAVAAFDRAIELRPTLSNAYLNRGASLDELELHDEAIVDYTSAVDNNPENADAYFNRARTFFYLGHIEEAISDYTEVLAIRSDDSEALNNRDWHMTLWRNIVTHCRTTVPPLHLFRNFQQP